MTDDKKTIPEKDQNKSGSENTIDNKEQVVKPTPKKAEKSTKKVSPKKKSPSKKVSSDSKKKEASKKAMVKEDKPSKLKKSWEPYLPNIGFIMKNIGIAFLTCALLEMFLGNIFGFSSILFSDSSGGSGDNLPETGFIFSAFLGLAGVFFVFISLLSLLFGAAIYTIAHFIVNNLVYLYEKRYSPKEVFSEIKDFFSIIRKLRNFERVVSTSLRYLPYVKILTKLVGLDGTSIRCEGKHWVRKASLLIFIVVPIVYFL
jgi:hypothetical protein